MAEIISFKGLMYNTGKIKNMEDATAPPYDVISKEQQDILYKKNDHNIIRLILGKEKKEDNGSENKYTRAASSLNRWMEEEILARDEKPSIYIYEQEYEFKSKKYTRRGFIALARLEDFKNNIIFPHERTLAKPKEDRLNLIRACRTNLSQIFCLYSDPGHVIDEYINKSGEMCLRMELRDSGNIKHSLYSVSDRETIDSITSAMKDKKLYIADGHHRYETALAYRDEQRKGNAGSTGSVSSDFVMMYFTNMDMEDMTILPIYRLISNINAFDPVKLENRLKECFDIEKQEIKGNDRNGQIDRLMQKMKTAGKDRPVFGMYCGNNTFTLLSLKDKNILKETGDDAGQEELRCLDINILHELIFHRMLGIDNSSLVKQKNVVYVVDELEACDAVDKGMAQAAFFVNPTKMDSLKKIVRAGERMPQKSTFFYPKLMTGLVMNRMD